MANKHYYEIWRRLDYIIIIVIIISITITSICPSQWRHGLRRRSAAARLLRLWVRIPPGAWMSVVSVVCCQVEVSATSWSLVQRSPTDCGAWLWYRNLANPYAELNLISHLLALLVAHHILHVSRIGVNEDALAYWGLSRQKKNQIITISRICATAARTAIWLQAGRIRFRFPARARNSSPLQNFTLIPGPTRPPVEWVPSVKQPGHWFNYSHPRNVEVNNEDNFISAPSNAIVAWTGKIYFWSY